MNLILGEKVDTVMTDYEFRFFTHRLTEKPTTKWHWEYCRTIKFDSGYKFSSELTLRKPMVVEIMRRITSGSKYDDLIESDMSYRIQGTDMCFLNRDVYSYQISENEDEEKNDFDRFVTDLREHWKHMKGFWLEDVRGWSEMVFKHYDKDVREFYTDFFNKRPKPRISEEERRDIIDSRYSWNLYWHGEVHGIPLEAHSCLVGSDFVAFRRYCQNEGKYVPYEFQVGDSIYKTTFGEYFNACSSTSKGLTPNPDWTPEHAFKSIGKVEKVELPEIESTPKLPISEVKFTIGCSWADGCGQSGIDDLVVNNRAELFEYLNYMSGYEESFYISPTAKDELIDLSLDLDVDEFQWDNEDLKRDTNMKDVWEDIVKDINYWLDRFVKKDEEENNKEGGEECES